MAAVMETFVGNHLLNKLEAFAEEKVVTMHGVRDELKKLLKNLRCIAPGLKDAERKRITDVSVKKWLNELKDVVYDTDNMIDIWRYNNKPLPFDKPSSSKAPIGCAIPMFLRSRSVSRHNEVAPQLKTLNARFEEIIKHMARLNLQHIKSEVQAVGTADARNSSPVIEVDVVGDEIEEGVNKLVKMAVINNKKKFNLVAITGMGGIGKTTLAQKVYNNSTIQNRYAEKMWLSVSQSNTAEQLIKAVIRGVGGNPGDSEKKSDLLTILANAISGKSFFLVLDDVWNPYQSFNLLQNALKSNATYGFILVTTRDQRIAIRMGAQSIHQVEVLSPKSGWELLCKRAYLTETDDIKSFEDVGAKIVENCGALPLTIKAIAGLLATRKKSRKEWETVLQSSAWSISGFPEELDRTLYLCYEDLSPELKQCFLHCSLYPPNISMSCYDLVRFWIAEGLIEERSDQVTESIAEGYYHELIRRNLLEPNQLSVDRTECQMHSLLRSLARYMSKGESFTAYQVLPNPNDISKLLRLSLLEADEGVCIPGPTPATLRLRTFIIFKCLSQIENHTFVRLKLLRVLHINEKGLNSIPESIGDLIHLRMLDLKYTSISILPESIGSLTNLLFLNLNGCNLLRTLPRSITRLCNLCHLNMSGTPITSVPKGLGELQKLNEIFGFQVVGNGSHEKDQNGWDLQELEGLSQLRRVSITKLERAKNVSSVFANKAHLKHLFLTFSKVAVSSDHMKQFEDENGREILEKLYPSPHIEKLRIMNYGSKVLPKWMSDSSLGDILPNLQYLELIGWSSCTVLPPFGSLPNLKYLRVEGASEIVRISSEFLGIMGWKGPDSPIAFPKLEYLSFENMPNWEEWALSGTEGENAQSWKLMPHIKLLSIQNCPKLRALPEGLQQLTAVQQLRIRETYNLKSIKDFPFECETLLIENNRSLEILSDLPRVKRLMVGYTHKLRRVSKLDSLEYIELVDYSSIEGLPKWLISLVMEERKDRSKDLHLVLFCSTALLKRCLKNGPNWPFIKCFSTVTAYNRDKTACLEYTREPESYITNIRG